VLHKADPKLAYAAQVRAARALLGWSQGDLAERAGISKQSVNRIESGNMDARLSTVSAMGEAFRSAGVRTRQTMNEAKTFWRSGPAPPTCRAPIRSGGQG
jgi:DNA-binding XRE family transcriptional regulator